MPYYRYEYHVINLIDILKKNKEGEQDEKDKYNSSDMNPDSMMKKARSMTPNVKSPNLPNAGNVKFPSMPKL